MNARIDNYREKTLRVVASSWLISVYFSRSMPFGAGAAEGVQCEVAACVVLSGGSETVAPDVCDLVAPDDAERLLSGDILIA